MPYASPMIRLFSMGWLDGPSMRLTIPAADASSLFLGATIVSVRSLIK